MSRQGLQYHPILRRLPLDSMLRVNPQQNGKRGRSNDDMATTKNGSSSRGCHLPRPGQPRLHDDVEVPGQVSKRLWRDVTTDRVTKKRLTGDLDAITNHLSSFRVMQSKNANSVNGAAFRRSRIVIDAPTNPPFTFTLQKETRKGKPVHYTTTATNVTD
jgi:hypothetical protein